MLTIYLNSFISKIQKKKIMRKKITLKKMIKMIKPFKMKIIKEKIDHYQSMRN